MRPTKTPSPRKALEQKTRSNAASDPYARYHLLPWDPRLFFANPIILHAATYLRHTRHSRHPKRCSSSSLFCLPSKKETKKCKAAPRRRAASPCSSSSEHVCPSPFIPRRRSGSELVGITYPLLLPQRTYSSRVVAKVWSIIDRLNIQQWRQKHSLPPHPCAQETRTIRACATIRKRCSSTSRVPCKPYMDKAALGVLDCY